MLMIRINCAWDGDARWRIRDDGYEVRDASKETCDRNPQLKFAIQYKSATQGCREELIG